MSVSNVSNSAVASTYTNNTQQVANTDTGAAAAKNTTAGNNTDTAAVYEKGNSKDKKANNSTAITRMIEESNRKVDSMKEMLKGLLKNQASKDAKAKGVSKDFALKSLYKGIANGDDVMVEISPEVRAKAAKEVSEDGYYGVKQTSQRILDFAKALVDASGGSPEMIDKMEKAVKEGFKQAGDMWGEEMPQITQDTYDAVMQGFKDWKESAGVAK